MYVTGFLGKKRERKGQKNMYQYLIFEFSPVLTKNKTSHLWCFVTPEQEKDKPHVDTFLKKTMSAIKF